MKIPFSSLFNPYILLHSYQEAKSQQQAKEEERLQQDLKAADRELQQLDMKKNRLLQSIENERTRAETLLCDDRVMLETRAMAHSGAYRTVSESKYA